VVFGEQGVRHPFDIGFPAGNEEASLSRRAFQQLPGRGLGIRLQLIALPHRIRIERAQTLQKAGVERLVLYPLNSHGRFLGYIMAINFDTEATEHIRETLELTSFFIASEIANNQFIDQLKMLNRTDLLTGVLNRNAMNARVSELSEAPCDSPCRMGVVFADMNGLKQINDLQGHSAGDLMLKNAAMILQSTFVGDEIYRAGGDEFMILLQETDPEDMRQRIAEIKKKSVLFDNVSFAAGCSPLNSRREIRKALAEADADMYWDKQNCYALHPELQRRR
jgi:diguanylate cyclase (GGDEF)-like protein